ncbi:AAC(3) family N-acetyltransferase [Paenibacillus alvei]|uniref:AAC(3) family N-acetyltransferase n=1 Tax=Paenibacillus alvei TaxID=44250 RepID=UPI00228143F3|nr:AAC(3) family N-acetyltransferase [Paenibacillus alvei]
MLNSQQITEKLLHALNPLISEGEDMLILHSALSKLGFERGAPYVDGLMEFLQALIDRGITVVLPSFTFSFTKRKRFCLNHDPSETGILADLARKHLQFSRSKNPMFSFSVKGPKEDEILLTRQDSGYGIGTAVSRLAAADTTVVMLGANWNCCTIIHAIEENLQVPYREYINWSYEIDFGDGAATRPFNLFVRKLDSNSILRFDRIRGELLQTGALRQSTLNGLYIEAANSGDIAEISEKRMRLDPYFFIE